MQHSKTLLIIGAGREQIPAYQLAKSKGLTVIGTDMAADAPALAFADHALIASTRDAEESVRVVREFAKIHPIDGVMTIANDVPYTVARIAAELGLPGIPPASAKLFAHKVKMKHAFRAKGVATPDYWPIADRAALTEALTQAEFPLILKPSDGRGARGVLYLEQDTDLDWAYEHARAAGDNGLLILERFIQGPQLSVEGLFVDGKYIGIAYADRNYDNLTQTKPFIIEDGGVIPSQCDAQLRAEIDALISRAAAALGSDWGSVKADIVVDLDGNPMVIELAGRLSGNYLATHHIPMTYDVDIVGALIDLSLGHRVDAKDLKKNPIRYLGVRYLFPSTGRITDITGVEDLRSKDYVWMLDIFRQPGDIQPTIDNHGARAGVVFCEGASWEQARDRACNAANSIHFKVEKT